MFVKQLENIKKKFDEYYYDQRRKGKDQSELKKLKTTKNKINLVVNLMSTSKESKIPVRTLIKQNSTKQDFWRKEKAHYSFKRKMVNLINHPDWSIKYLLNKSKTRKTISYKYSKTQRQEIVDTFFNPNNWHNIASLWIVFRSKKGFENISINTFRKIICADKRYQKILKQHKIRHPRRKYNLELGNLQMDIKIIPARDTNISRKIYEIDFIDEQTKLIYSKIIHHQNLSEIMLHTKNAINFFEANAIKIKRIRTDNYMAFKKTNFVKNGRFDRHLRSQGIIHEFIPLGEPQCNGVTERFHKIIDDEFLPRTDDLTSLECFSNKYNEWVNFYNTTRNHYYETIKTKSHAGKFLTPMQMLKKTLNQI